MLCLQSLPVGVVPFDGPLSLIDIQYVLYIYIYICYYYLYISMSARLKIQVAAEMLPRF